MYWQPQHHLQFTTDCCFSSFVFLAFLLFVFSSLFLPFSNNVLAAPTPPAIYNWLLIQLFPFSSLRLFSVLYFCLFTFPYFCLFAFSCFRLFVFLSLCLFCHVQVIFGHKKAKCECQPVQYHFIIFNTKLSKDQWKVFVVNSNFTLIFVKYMEGVIFVKYMERGIWGCQILNNNFSNIAKIWIWDSPFSRLDVTA